MNIFQRINAVMREVEYVQKDKQVSGGGASYKAVTHDQVVSVIRGALVKHGIVVYPEQTSNSIPIMRDVKNDVKMHLYSAEYIIHFVNIDDSVDRLSVSINAHSNDNGDKAPGKAVTYATKTAILKVFSLETGEDDESRSESRNTITGEQVNELAAMIAGNGALWANLCNAYKIGALEEINIKKFDEIKNRITDYKTRQNANN